MSGKTQLEVVGVFGTIHIKNCLAHDYFDNGYLAIKAGDDGTHLGHEHDYLFKEWYYIRIINQ